MAHLEKKGHTGPGVVEVAMVVYQTPVLEPGEKLHADCRNNFRAYFEAKSLMELELKLEWPEGVSEKSGGLAPPRFVDTPSSHSNFNSNSIKHFRQINLLI